MRFRNLALGAAAALALSVLAGPSTAQQSPYSTPPGRDQTGTLSARQANGTTEEGQPETLADAQYKAQLQRYQDQQQQYEDQKAQYQNRLARYEYDRSHPREWWAARYGDATLLDFYSIPHHDLIGKEVDGRDGLRLGRIRDVERGADGRVERVDVALNADRAAWIDARNLRYDPRDEVMFTDVPADDLYDSSREGY